MHTANITGRILAWLHGKFIVYQETITGFKALQDSCNIQGWVKIEWIISLKCLLYAVHGGEYPNFSITLYNMWCEVMMQYPHIVFPCIKWTLNCKSSIIAKPMAHKQSRQLQSLKYTMHVVQLIFLRWILLLRSYKHGNSDPTQEEVWRNVQCVLVNTKRKEFV